MSQPIDVLMTRLELSNADLVRASTQQLSFKNVQKARTGRRLTPNIQDKILVALLKLKPELKLARRDLFRYDIGEGVVGAVHEALSLIANQKIDYPQFVDHLLQAGITRYVVEVGRHQVTYFGIAGEAHVEQGAPISETAPGRYDVDAVKSAITDVQKRLIDYPAFLQRIHAAGILSYEANLRSREIRYRGAVLSYKEQIPQVGVEPKVAAAPKPSVPAIRKNKKKPGRGNIKVPRSLKARKAAKKGWKRKR